MMPSKALFAAELDVRTWRGEADGPVRNTLDAFRMSEHRRTGLLLGDAECLLAIAVGRTRPAPDPFWWAVWRIYSRPRRLLG